MPNRFVATVIALALLLTTLGSCFHFETPYTRRKSSLYSNRDQKQQQENDTCALAGIDSFEQWLRNDPAAVWDSNVEHAIFGKHLRGLRWKGPMLTKPTLVAQIPAAKVLSSENMSNNNQSLPWDVHLATQLWEQCVLGEASQYYGYIQLLTRGTTFDPNNNNDCPEPTAPNALRHWNRQQRIRLEESLAGKQLLNLVDQQQDNWRQKYNQLQASRSSNILRMSYKQFEWAMEVVHSRAFRGDFTDTSSSWFSFLVPLLAAVIGFGFSRSEEPNSWVLVGLAATATLPLAMEALSTKQSAVLLPLIDSANHVESADSKIVYNPLTSSFQLTVGPQCIDPISKQLFVSYGRRSDAELLLNYGFLPTVVTCGEEREDDAAGDLHRQQLANLFVQRNAARK